MIRGTGALLDPVGEYKPSSEIVGTLAHPPEEHDGIQRWCPPVGDQGSTNACVAFAFAAAIYARAGVEGRPQVLASRMALWYFARARGGTVHANAGVAPTDMFLAASEIGVPPEWVWSLTRPFDKAPDQEAMRIAADQHEVECGRVLGEGTERKRDIQVAVCARYPLPITIASDEGYAFQRTGVWKPGGSFLGYHEVLGVRYTRAGLVTLGSYGVHHGQAGYTLIPWDVVMDEHLVRDPWAVRLSGGPMPEAA